MRGEAVARRSGAALAGCDAPARTRRRSARRRSSLDASRKRTNACILWMSRRDGFLHARASVRRPGSAAISQQLAARRAQAPQQPVQQREASPDRGGRPRPRPARRTPRDSEAACCLGAGPSRRSPSNEALAPSVQPHRPAPAAHAARDEIARSRRASRESRAGPVECDVDASAVRTATVAAGGGASCRAQARTIRVGRRDDGLALMTNGRTCASGTSQALQIRPAEACDARRAATMRSTASYAQARHAQQHLARGAVDVDREALAVLQRPGELRIDLRDRACRRACRTSSSRIEIRRSASASRPGRADARAPAAAALSGSSAADVRDRAEGRVVDASQLVASRTASTLVARIVASVGRVGADDHLRALAGRREARRRAFRVLALSSMRARRLRHRAAGSSRARFSGASCVEARFASAARC